jgi:hypothetical protein
VSAADQLSRSPIHYNTMILADCSPVATIEELATWNQL